MTLTETGLVGRLYCPGCEPEADEVVEVLTVNWCRRHAPCTVAVPQERPEELRR